MNGPVLCFVACATALAVTGATAAPASAPAGRTVVIRGVAFSPSTVVIRAGARVTWRWQDGSVAHNVRSRGSRRFPGSATKATGTHSARFTRPGTYRYVCTIHEAAMTARVVVR